MADVTFLGACGVVTGSSTLLSWGKTRVLIDCGMYQGPNTLERRNREDFAFDPKELTAVILTHAHLDHTGLVPRLVRKGYSGPIYCSPPTRSLASLVLQDSAKIQEEEAAYAKKKGYSVHRNPQPLYRIGDAKKALRLFNPRPFDQWHEVAPGIRFRLARAGHLLGAASVEVSAKGSDGNRRTWLFSGDIGRYDVPILKDPEAASEGPEGVLLESTYGDRDHVTSSAKLLLGEIVERTMNDGGSVIIPAFALGRTQEVLFHLSDLVEEGVLSADDVFLDSPMAISATEIYENAKKEHDEELLQMVREGNDPFDHDAFQRCRRAAESKKLNSRKRPCVIVASSGMATGGRVVHHLKIRLSNPKNAVIFVGYQAGGTRGRALVNGADRVAIHGQEIPVRASIYQIAGLSAHADRNELLRWAEALPGVPKQVFLNHGEDPARKALAAALEGIGWPRPRLPESGDVATW